MRQLFCALALLVCVSTAQAQVTSNDLVGLGMPAEQARKIASIANGTGALWTSEIKFDVDDFMISSVRTDQRLWLGGGEGHQNDDGGVLILHGKDHPTQPSQAVLRAPGDGLVSIKSTGTGTVFLGVQDQGRWGLIGSGDTVKHFNQTAFSYVMDSADGSDNKALRLGGGGDVTKGRGAHVWFGGNEYSGYPGKVFLRGGDVTTGDVNLDVTNASAELNVTSDGTVKVQFVGAERIINFVGAMGNSSLDPTTDAPADWVQVQINGTSYYLPAYAGS